MSQALLSFSAWLHALATVVFIGHYLLLAVVYLPAMASSQAEVVGPILSAVSKRSRTWLYASLLVFLVTGIYLTLIDSNYLGIGDFGNLWSVLMLVKHTLILAMIAIGFFYNAILRVGPMMSSNNGAKEAIARFAFHTKLMAICGVLVLFLTAFAQFE